MNFDKLRSCLLTELDNRKRQIEDGQYNWFSVKVTFRGRNGEPTATFQSEEVCQMNGQEVKLFLNRGRG